MLEEAVVATEPSSNVNNISTSTRNNNNNNNNVSVSTAVAATATATTDKKEKPKEYNPRWKGYVFIGLSSLINFVSVSNIDREDRPQVIWPVSMIFGVFTFTLAIVILSQDRSQRCLEPIHYTKAWNGRLEGYTLLLTVAWWVAGVSYLTQVDGIAYFANNIYFSSWLCLFCCIYTLNEWSTSKDILSIEELTGVSTTLKSWYVVLLSGLVVMGTSSDLYIKLGEEFRDDAAFGVFLGIISTVIAIFFILVHYNFITMCTQGGWLELSSSFLLILLWIVGVVVLTQDQGIAATLAGTKCGRQEELADFLQNPDCSVVLLLQQQQQEQQLMMNETEIEIDEITTILDPNFYFSCRDLPRQVPGSNLYFACWACFTACINVAFRWKAAQALQFAQTTQERELRRQQQQANVRNDRRRRNNNDGSGGSDNEDDDSNNGSRRRKLDSDEESDDDQDDDDDSDEF